MKAATFSLIVILLSAVGAHALASEFDLNVEKSAKETKDTTTGENSHGDGTGGRIEK